MKVANAPLSYGAFEMTVGTDFPVPVAARACSRRWPRPATRAPSSARPATWATRTCAACELVGGFIQIAFTDPDASSTSCTRRSTAFGDATHARPVLCDAGGPERVANPGRGGEDPSLRLDDARWRTLVDGVERAADAARERGFEPVFHHHTSTYVESVEEIERLLEDTDVPLLLDCAHLVVAGGDPLQALARLGRADRGDPHQGRAARRARGRQGRARRHADRVAARAVLRARARATSTSPASAARVEAIGYDGWVVVEQDRVLDRRGRLRARRGRPGRQPPLAAGARRMVNVGVIGAGLMGSTHARLLSERGRRRRGRRDLGRRPRQRGAGRRGARRRHDPRRRARADRRPGRRRGRDRLARRHPRAVRARLHRGRQAGAVREAAGDVRGGRASGSSRPRSRVGRRSSPSASCAATTRATRTSRRAWTPGAIGAPLLVHCAHRNPCVHDFFDSRDDHHRHRRPRGRHHPLAAGGGDRARDGAHAARRRAGPARACATRS